MSTVYSLVGTGELLTAGTSVVAEHGLLGAWASVAVACGLSRFSSRALGYGFSHCGAWASLLLGMWDHPRSGIEPCLLHLLHWQGFFTIEKPGKPSSADF